MLTISYYQEINSCLKCNYGNLDLKSLACVPFTKSEGRIQKFKETRDWRCIYQNELDKACFQYVMVYGNFKYLPRITDSDKVLRDKAFNFGINEKHYGYQCGLTSIVYKFFG